MPKLGVLSKVLSGNGSAGSFMRDVAKLSSGAVGGRVIAFAALPILSRLYSPEDFALLAVYQGLVAIVAIAACLRLEIAIPLVSDDGEAVHLLILTFVVASAVMISAFIVVLLIPEVILEWTGKPILALYLWLLPAGIAAAAAYSALQQWATRRRHFGSVARTRITQALSSVTVMLGVGWAGWGPIGLLLGSVANSGAGVGRLGRECLKDIGKLLSEVSWRELKRVFGRYWRYPVFSVPESLANVAGSQVPVLVIASLAGKEAGFLHLAMQVMAAPMALLGSAISQVYVSRASEEMNAGRLAPFTADIMRRLIRIGVGPLIFVCITAPLMFPLVFGSQWSRAGEIVSLLVPWIALQLIVSPVSMVMFVAGRQRAMLVLTILGFLLRLGGVVVAHALYQEHLVVGFVIGSVFYYLLVGAFVVSVAKFRMLDYQTMVVSLWHWSIPLSVSLGLVTLWFSSLLRVS